MAKHLLHKKSQLLVDGKAKLPTSADIEYGEIAINYADGYECISIKNNTNEIITFSSDEQIKKLIADSSGETVDAYTKTESDARYVLKSGDTMTGSLNVQGTVSATSTIYSSDITLKENIKSISNNDIEKIRKIELKEYQFINDSDKKIRYGGIAQDLEKEGLENLVYTDEIDGKKGIDYISMLILKVEQLQKDLNKVYGMYEDIKDKYDSLTK